MWPAPPPLHFIFERIFYTVSTSRFALFVDLENCGAKAATLLNILEKVKIRGDILLGKVYGYTDRFSDLKEILLSNTFTVVPSLRHGVAQKNNADILLVLDALEVAYTNPLIDSFCIVSGDSDYTPLVGRLKSMGKFVLGISRSEVASSIFINACNEFQFLESVGASNRKTRGKRNVNKDEPLDDAALNKVLEDILSEQEEDEMFASELKGVLLRLRPDFNEKSHGCATFGKLLTKLSQKFGTIRIKNDNFNVLVSLVGEENAARQEQMTRDNWKAVFTEQLRHYRDDGFERINPSILKADITAAYPDFSEKAIGFKRFSDVLKQLEKDKVLSLEMDEQKNMLIRCKAAQSAE
ncbi:MAG: NYN domain-containing protein [Clostridiales bacterium]|nr:NYN domain-containing protein [Clostridiales bacterium]